MAMTTSANAASDLAHWSRRHASPRARSEGPSTALRPTRSDSTPITGWATRPDTPINMR